MDLPTHIARRSFLGRAGTGLGVVALATLLERESLPAGPVATKSWAGWIKALHHAPKAKRVFFHYMPGGPSPLEPFDNKPELARHDGQPRPASFTRGQPIAQLHGQALVCLGPRFPFQ